VVQHYATRVINNSGLTVLSARQKWFKDLVGKHANGDVKAFAAKSGVDRSTVSQYVNARKEPSDKHVIRVANRLNLQPPDDVLTYTPESKAPAREVPSTVSREDYDALIQLMRAQVRLTNQALDRIDALSEQVAELLKR
jgi:transcriptional regulator with XRE-family HTH domain